MAINTNQQLTFSRQINVTNADGSDIPCVNCYATIQSNSSISVTYDIVNSVVFQANKVEVKAAITLFLDYAKAQAELNGIEVL